LFNDFNKGAYLISQLKFNLRNSKMVYVDLFIEEKTMKPQIFLSVLSIAALMLACNLPAASQQTSPTQEAGGMALSSTVAPNTTLPATSTQPAETPTDTLTPQPSESPTITPTATLSIPKVTPAKDPVNCRFGPGVEWLTVGALKVGESATVMGKTTGGNWWYIQLPSNPQNFCWVAASVTVPSGSFDAIAVVAPPQALVTKVSLELDPTEISVPGCVFPYTPIDLKATITTNGPTVVEWHWETSQGNTSASEDLTFKKYDTLPVSDYTKYDKEGNYWVKLVVTKPNSMVAQAKYKVICGP
jgi:hypothetical protein